MPVKSTRRKTAIKKSAKRSGKKGKGKGTRKSSVKVPNRHLPIKRWPRRSHKKSAQRQSKNTKIKIKTTKGWLKPDKLNWVDIAKGHIFISTIYSRQYWVIAKLPKKERPKISFNDKTNTIKINTYQIKFNRPIDYKRSKDALS